VFDFFKLKQVLVAVALIVVIALLITGRRRSK